LYLVVAYYAGLYDKQYKPSRLVRAAVTATLVLLALYALLPEHYRFSRGILLFGVLLAAGVMIALRWALAQLNIMQPAVYTTSKPYIVIAGSVAEYGEVKKLVNGNSHKIIGRVALAEDGAEKLATLSQVNTVAGALNAHELILCSGTASNKQLIAFIQTLRQSLRLRFHAAGSGSIVGSDSSTASGEVLSAATFFNLSMPMQRRLKRLIDLTAALVFLIFFPLHFLLVKKPVRLMANAAAVLVGQKTWIGYVAPSPQLPPLRPAVLTPDGIPVHGHLKKAYPELVEGLDAEHYEIDFWYAQNWEPLQDARLILKNYPRLGS
jgi:hypothetical protein